MWYPDKPSSQGVENGIMRARSITDYRWTPLKKIPCNHVAYYQDRKEYKDEFFMPGLPKKGVIYSSARIVDKHVGFEVEPDTYASALINPDSVLYKRNLHGTSGHGVGCYYGIVCSAFVSYTHNLPRQVVCREFTSYEGISTLDITSGNFKNTIDSLRLLDIVLHPTQHVATITGILRDAEGHVQMIEVSEATLPLCRRVWYKPQEFCMYWLDSHYIICRNANVDRITLPAKIKDYSDMKFMNDYGDKANYALGEPVVFTALDDIVREVLITKLNDNGTNAEGFQAEPVTLIDGRGEYVPTAPGRYRASADLPGTSQSVEFYVFDAKAASNKAEYAVGEPIELEFSDNLNQDSFFMYYIKNSDRYKKYKGDITENEKKAGRLTAPGLDTPGDYYIVFYTRSPFALYGSIEIKITVK